MKKIVQRLIIFFVGLPFILGSVYFLPQYHFLVLHIEILAVTIAALIEVHTILSKRLPVYPFPFMFLIGISLPLVSYTTMLGILPSIGMVPLIAAVICSIFLIEIGYSFSNTFELSIARMASAVFMFIYPGFFICFLSRMTAWTSAAASVTLFLLTVFACDSMAWLFGMLFGKSTRGIVPASPNKSLVGFIGGLVGAPLCGIAFFYLVPGKLPLSAYSVVIIGTATGIAAILGDIIESILKRSATMKDSGSLVMGRGGILDSIDSILFAAPVFYIFYSILASGT